MTHALLDLLLDYAPHPRSRATTGFLNFNCPCCLAAGEPRSDTRQRGGLKSEADGTLVYVCFNCNTKAVWKPGDALSRSMIFVMRCFGISEDRVRRIKFELYRLRQEQIDRSGKPQGDTRWRPSYPPSPLPPEARPLTEWLEQTDPPQGAVDAAHYMLGRGVDLLSRWTYYWSPSTKVDMHRRIIIPFLHDGNIVGWTARLIDSTEDPLKPRYYNGFKPKHYLFNNAVLSQPHRKYIILVEGSLDAIAIDGVGVLGKSLTVEQTQWIKQSGKTVIVLPDGTPDRVGLIDIAARNDWMVSFPWAYRDPADRRWDHDVKDAAEAVRRYGRVYTVRSIIERAFDDKAKFEMMKKRLRRPA